MSKPSDGMELDELRDEFDWMFEFQSHIAEQIMGDSDVHNHVEYVRKLEAENDKLRKKINALKAHGIEIVDAVAGGYEIYDIRQREVDRLEVENGKLRKALCAAWKCVHAGISCSGCRLIAGGCTLQTAMCELEIEVPE